ncbi:transcriptional regulator [Actinosynnema sp. NPDC059797]
MGGGSNTTWPVAHTVKLRVEAFEKAARLAGYQSGYSLARAMGVNRSTVMRMLKGSIQPGPVFIGSALAALAPMEFGDLFEVVEFPR